MADLLWLLLLLITTFGFLAGSMLLRVESGGFWSLAWALLAAAGASAVWSAHWPWLLELSFAFGSLFPFAMLAGSLSYAGQPRDDSERGMVGNQ